MNDYRKLAGQTVDGWYYLLPDDVVQPTDEWSFADSPESGSWLERDSDCIGAPVHKCTTGEIVCRRRVAQPQDEPPPDTQRSHGQCRCRELEELVRRVVANAGRLAKVPGYRWAHVMEATGLGSTSAKALCREHGFDPDEEIPARSRIKLEGEG